MPTRWKPCPISRSSTSIRASSNADLAPICRPDRSWGWFEIFNVWSNVVQSLFGYTLTASMFLAYGLNGWADFGAIYAVLTRTAP